MRVGPVVLLAAALVLGASGVWAAEEPPALIRARGLYNAADYDAAIEAAAEARRIPEAAITAAVVQARAYLERYRQSRNASDLAAAHEALTEGSAGSATLAPRDYVDLLVGLGQYLYFTEAYGPAAELFDNALMEGFLLNPRERLLLLDWWANAMERSAQGRPPGTQQDVFGRLLARMIEESRRDPASQVANYWLPVAARGAGDLPRAWDLAVAGWVRSSLAPETAYQMRQDLDRFVVEALVPELARTRKDVDAQAAAAELREEWEQLKRQWP